MCDEKDNKQCAVRNDALKHTCIRRNNSDKRDKLITFAIFFRYIHKWKNSVTYLHCFRSFNLSQWIFYFFAWLGETRYRNQWSMNSNAQIKSLRTNAYFVTSSRFVQLTAAIDSNCRLLCGWTLNFRYFQFHPFETVGDTYRLIDRIRWTVRSRAPSIYSSTHDRQIRMYVIHHLWHRHTVRMTFVTIIHFYIFQIPIIIIIFAHCPQIKKNQIVSEMKSLNVERLLCNNGNKGHMLAAWIRPSINLGWNHSDGDKFSL